MSYLNKDYLKLVETYFDINDNKTRKVLLNINEADQQSVVTSLVNKLYGFIVDKAKKVDFGEIPKSKGDITKITGYNDMVNILDTIEELLGEFKQTKTSPVTTVKQAITNMESRKDAFNVAFLNRSEMGMLMYDTMALAVISGVNIVAYSTIEFIKNPDNTFETVVDKMAVIQSEKSMVIRNLDSFNKACEKEQFDKALHFVTKTGDTAPVNEFAINPASILKIVNAGMVAGTVIFLIFQIVPFLRSLVYYYFYARTKVSDFFEAQADVLVANALAVEANNEIDPTKRKQIAEKQVKISQKLRSYANSFAIKNKKSENEAERAIASEDRQYKIDDVIDEIPDSALSLF